MHVHQFFIEPEKIVGEQVTLSGAEFHHCCRTLRFGEGDQLQVCDGRGHVWQVRLSKVGKQSATGIIESALPSTDERPKPVILGVGITRGRAMEAIVEVATVLGVARLVPLRSKQAVAGDFNYERYRRVAIAALKQSGRAYLPEILPVQDWQGFLSLSSTCDLKILCEQHSAQSIRALVDTHQRYSSIAAVVGPEGGLASEEVELLNANGYQPINLSKVRLRSELAVTMLIFYLNLLVNTEVVSGY